MNENLDNLKTSTTGLKQFSKEVEELGRSLKTLDIEFGNILTTAAASINTFISLKGILRFDEIDSGIKSTGERVKKFFSNAENGANKKLKEVFDCH